MLQSASVASDIVSSWLDAGATLEEIEQDLLELAPLSEDQRSALWLYAWSQLRHTDGFRRTPSAGRFMGGD